MICRRTVAPRPPRAAARLRRRVAGARVAAMLPRIGSRRLVGDPLVELLRVREGRRTFVSRRIFFALVRRAGMRGRLRVGARSAAGSSAPDLPRGSAPRSAADSLSILPTLARRDDNVCDRLEVTRLANKLRDRERGSRSVVAYERHGAASRLAVELERAVRPMLGAWDSADGVGHDPAIPGGSVAQSSQRHIDIMS